MEFEKRVDLMVVALDGMTREEWEIVQALANHEFQNQEKELQKTMELCTTDLKERIMARVTRWGEKDGLLFF